MSVGLSSPANLRSRCSGKKLLRRYCGHSRYWRILASCRHPSEPVVLEADSLPPRSPLASSEAAEEEEHSSSKTTTSSTQKTARARAT